jgi:Flp pilus assembly protein TadD
MHASARTWLLAFALVAFVVAVFWPSRQYPFLLYDDPIYVTQNPVVIGGLDPDGLVLAVTTTPSGNWIPLTWVSHMTDVALFGMNASAHRTVNILIHALNSAMVLLLLFRLSGAVWRSLAVASLFAVHPLRVESVVWISERKDVLSVFFALLTLLAYASYAHRRTTMRYVVMTLLYAGSLLAKPMFVTLPLVMLLLDYWPLQRIRLKGPLAHDAAPTGETVSIQQSLLEKVPLAVLAIAISIVAFLSQLREGSVEVLQVLSIGDRLANVPVAYVRYILKTLSPVGLAVLYPHPLSWPAWKVLVCTAVIAAASVLAVVARRRVPAVFVGWFWFLITLVPVLGIVQVGVQSLADRYSYFPQIGLLIAVVWAITSLLSNQRHRTVATVVACAIALALCLRTRNQMRVWSDTQTLYAHAVAVTDGNWHMHGLLGELLDSQHRLDIALQHYQAAAEAAPHNASIQAIFADALIRNGKFSDAMSVYDQLLEIAPDHLEALNNQAWFLATHWNPRVRNAARAVQLAEHACALTSYSDPSLLDTLAAAYARAGRFDDALSTAHKAYELAMTSNSTDLAEMISAHIRLFEASRPVQIPSDIGALRDERADSPK